MDPWMPVFRGFMLRLDDGSRVWVQFRYECVHKLCTRCGLIGHSRGQCTQDMDEIERWIHRQRRRIQRIHQVQFGFDVLEPLFANNLRAYHNRRRRWATQIGFGNINHNPHIHSHDQPPNLENNDVPSPNQTSEVNYQTLHVPVTPLHFNNANDSSNSPQHIINRVENAHASLNSAILSLNLGTDVNHLTPLNSPFIEGCSQNALQSSQPQHTRNPISLNEQTDSTFSLRPPGQLPVSSDLRWTWVGGEGPFITKGELRGSNMDSSETESDPVTERLYNLDKLNEDRPEVLVGAAWGRGQIPESSEELVESLVQRVNRGMVRFERGSSSLGQNL